MELQKVGNKEKNFGKQIFAVLRITDENNRIRRRNRIWIRIL
jgi:hypothetical protein